MSKTYIVLRASFTETEWISALIFGPGQDIQVVYKPGTIETKEIEKEIIDSDMVRFTHTYNKDPKVPIERNVTSMFYNSLEQTSKPYEYSSEAAALKALPSLWDATKVPLYSMNKEIQGKH